MGRDVFTLSIYRLIIFPKPLGYIDDAILDLFDQLDWVPLLGIWGVIGYTRQLEFEKMI
ncbi:hypothetical protein Godav_024837 [Gossypium davidsonii]|uniref:Uncharacterized protein n=1 Tax=Gossypium davidsonii TaxID=34287 RepID=A0A7J8TH95_GOSDV|nr:hypothetical protein [Gossypium davidsonii]